MSGIHLVNRELTRVCAEVCDNYVLGCRDVVTYGETLLRLAELAHGATPVAGSIGILHWSGKLDSRIAAVGSTATV